MLGIGSADKDTESRTINISIWRSSRFQKLAPIARVLFLGMISNADDQGRGHSNPTFLRNVFLPYDENISTSEVKSMLECMSESKLIILYSDGVEEKAIYQIVDWWRFQDIKNPKESKFPSPSGWTDKCAVDTKKDKTFIYLMIDESTGMYKIGRTNNPLFREMTLQSEKPTIRLVAKIKRHKKHERELHKKYKSKRVRGEWFRLDESDVMEILSSFNTED